MVISRGRVALLAAVVLTLAAGWSAWLAYRAYDGLLAAQSAVSKLTAAVEAGDEDRQRASLDELDEAARQVSRSTGGAWWGALTHAPVVGDDLEAVSVIGIGLERSVQGASALLQVNGGMQDLTKDGAIDLEVVAELSRPVRDAEEAFRGAADDAAGVDADGLAGVLRDRFLDYRGRISELADGLSAANTAVDLLPAMAGGNQERNYLLVFQNNAEIRATGGLPGSWARVEAVDGRLTLREQGAWTDFPTLEEPVVPLSDAEQVAIQGGYGLTFQSAGYSRDFPRAAEIWNGFWEDRYPATDLDGVVALDPVALSYLVEGTGPVQVGDQTLTSANLIKSVLSDPYLRLTDPVAQDEFFQQAARSIFAAVTSDLASPAAFVEGLVRAGREGRLLVAPFERDEAARLHGTTVAGELTGDSPQIPYVGVGLNDATGSKLSYYLRYNADVVATSCAADRQTLAGNLSLRQNIAPADAAQLPPYVTADGNFGTEPGSQLLSVELYGPAGGSFEAVQIDGVTVEGLTVARLDNGQPIARLSVLLDSRDAVRVTWSMRSGDGQVADPYLSVTPGVVPGTQSGSSESACE